MPLHRVMYQNHRPELQDKRVCCSRADVFLRHQPIVGLALAAAAALSSDVDTSGTSDSSASIWSQWERCADLERQLLLSLPDGSQGAAMLKPVLLDAIESTKKVCGGQRSRCSCTVGCVLSLTQHVEPCLHIWV